MLFSLVFDLDSDISAEELLKHPHEAAEAICDQPSIFEALPASDKRRVYGTLKKVKPYPEFKEDFAWVIAWMKEDLEATEEDEANGLIGKIIEARNADELAAAAKSGVNTFVQTPEQVAKEGEVINFVVERGATDKGARNERIIQLRDEGKTLRQIGEAVGLSGPRVSGILRLLSKGVKSNDNQ